MVDLAYFFNTDSDRHALFRSSVNIETVDSGTWLSVGL